MFSATYMIISDMWFEILLLIIVLLALLYTIFGDTK